MNDSSFVSYDLATEITKSSTLELPAPTLTWEQYILLNLEIERLSTANRHLLVENEAFKAQSKKDAATASETEALRVNLAKAEHEVDVLKTHTRRMFDLEIRISALVKENQGFSSQLSQKLKDIDTLNQRYEEVNEAAMRYSSLHQTRVAENEELQVQLLTMRQEIDTVELLKGQNKQLSTQLKDFHRTKDDLKTTLAKKEQEITDLKKRLTNVTELRSGLEMGEEERGSMKRDYEESQTLVEELRAKIDELEDQLALVSTEKDKTSSTVKERQREVEELRRTVKEVPRLQEKLASADKEKEYLKADLEKKADDYEKSKEEIKQLLLLGAHRHKEIERLKSQVYNLTQSEKNSTKEKEKMSVLLLQKTREIEELRVEVQRFKKDGPRKVDKLLEEKEAKEYKNKLKRIADAERKLQGLLNENRRLVTENDRLSVFLIEKTKEAEKFRAGRSKINAGASTPKTSMASLGVEKTSFGELALQRIRESDGPRKSAPLNVEASEESADGSAYNKKVYTQTMLDKDKVITQLSARVLDYERQLAYFNGQKKKSASVEKKRLMRSNTGTDQVKSLKDLRCKTMTKVESISEFSTFEEERDRLAVKVEKQKKDIDNLRSELKKMKSRHEKELAGVLREKDHLNTGLNEKYAEVDLLMSKLKDMENELNKALEHTKAIVLANDNPKLVTILEKKMKNIDEMRSKFLALEKAYNIMKDTDQSDTTNESPTRTSTVQALTDEGLIKRKDRLNDMKRLERDKSSTTDLKRSNFSFDALTMSPDHSPIFDSKWF